MRKSRFHSNDGKIQYTSEEDTKSALIQLFIFFLYLICLTVVCNSLTSENLHHFTNGVKTLFERPHYMLDNRTISFSEVITIEDFWNYMDYVVINLLHGVVFNETSGRQPYLVSNRPLLYGKMILNESLLLGAPRLRQIRVRNDTCPLKPAFFRYYNTCVAPYSEEVEFREPFYKRTKYRTMSELGVTSIKGRVNTYNSGGYVQSLTYEKDINIETLRHLNNSKWLDRNSRVVLFEFSIINLNLNVLQSIK
ncbi:polycystin-2-like [Drosophila innubila]|uniref:polycystin-2-like n=1 Tax=Drosophila innubila TaxID=198719 RepID=UPI00148B6BBC|nr:polycystin-2-like [Drosophila innubila]